jgi:hypothetical protein
MNFSNLSLDQCTVATTAPMLQDDLTLNLMLSALDKSSVSEHNFLQVLIIYVPYVCSWGCHYGARRFFNNTAIMRIQ